MGVWSRGRKPKSFKHGEALSKSILSSRGYPEFILDSVEELSQGYCYWLVDIGVHIAKPYEYETIVYGLFSTKISGKEFIMYIHNTSICMYEYTLDAMNNIGREIEELQSAHKSRSGVFNKLKRSEYISDEEKRNKVIETSELELKKLHSKLQGVGRWETTTDNSWYRRSLAEPIEIGEDNTIEDVNIAKDVLLDFARIELGTSEISIIIA